MIERQANTSAMNALDGWRAGLGALCHTGIDAIHQLAESRIQAMTRMWQVFEIATGLFRPILEIGVRPSQLAAYRPTVKVSAPPLACRKRWGASPHAEIGAEGGKIP